MGTGLTRMSVAQATYGIALSTEKPAHSEFSGRRLVLTLSSSVFRTAVLHSELHHASRNGSVMTVEHIFHMYNYHTLSYCRGQHQTNKHARD